MFFEILFRSTAIGFAVICVILSKTIIIYNLTKRRMSRQPMTPAGVNDKITALYLLSDTALQAEAEAVQSDFKAWIKTGFILSPKQADYLDSLNNQIAAYFGSQASICFSNRLPIELIYPEPPTGEYSKWTGSSNTLAVKSDGSGKPTATGSLTFEFSYTV